MFAYPLTANQVDSEQRSPAWVVLFVRYSPVHTFDRITDLPLNNVSPAAELLPQIVVASDCISFRTESNKRSHTKSANLVLVEGQYNYTDILSNGDWMFIWAMDNQTDYYTILNIITHPNPRANYSNSGLKFVGRVTGAVRNVTKDNVTGRRTIHHNIDGMAFSELSLPIYYNPTIGLAYQDMALGGIWKQFADISSTLVNNIINQGYVEEKTVTDSFIKVFLGAGPSSSFQQSGQSANTVYIVPNTVKNLLLPLNKPPIQNGTYTFADILYTLIGIQNYGSDNGFNRTNSSPWQPGNYLPFLNSVQLSGYQNDNSLTTNLDLPGKFYNSTLTFNNTPLWSILESYVNTPFSEIFTTLRVNYDGYIYPTVVHRQLPLTSDVFVQNNNFPATPFSTVPRWVLDDSLVTNYSLGKSDNLRKNWLQIIGQWWNNAGNPINTAQQMQLVQPSINTIDVMRHGPRPEQHQSNFINTLIESGTAGNNIAIKFNDLMTDIMFDGEKRYSGRITCKGIQAPIAIGDNLEYNGNLYQIESLTHGGDANTETGHRNFVTSIQVSFGTSLQSNSSQLAFPTLDDNHSETVE